jgi:hypothetical protein
LTDTEEFLHSIKEYKETALNATHFIHSTYNQLNGMISLSKKINSYNITYVHRGFSFEHSLMDAALLFDENEIETALVGSFDEMTQEHFDVKKAWGYWKSEMINSFDLLDHKTKGTISGEGSAFFMLSKHKPDQACVSIRQVATLFRPTRDELHEAMHEIFRAQNLKLQDVDLLLSGDNGDLNFSDSYNDVHAYFDDTTITYFKHLCGEYDTASSFACWLAAQMLLTQTLPDYVRPSRVRNNASDKKMKTVLIYNNYFDVNQTLILLQLEESFLSKDFTHIRPFASYLFKMI